MFMHQRLSLGCRHASDGGSGRLEQSAVAVPCFVLAYFPVGLTSPYPVERAVGSA